MLLNDSWTMIDGESRYACSVPCSAMQVLLREGVIPDPYYRENEWISTPVSERDFTFEKAFVPDASLLQADQVILSFEGIDTLGRVFLNDALLGETDNMHRTWEYSVKELLLPGENRLRVELRSPLRYAREMQEKRPLTGSAETFPGYPHLRKAHCMFGWDWGPILPDLGLWRDVSLRGVTGGRIFSTGYTQEHADGKVVLHCRADLELLKPGIEARLSVTSPSGETVRIILKNGRGSVTINNPELWWVRGLGEQPLYTCRVELLFEDAVLDVQTRRIGLRTLTVSREKDLHGREFCFVNNGVKVFAMGGNYIPEDQILPRITPERTRRLLEDCREANFNFIRIWGGGFYPADSFYDWCDENGFMVWQDFMFACSAYVLSPEFEKTVREEIRENVRRLRNHPSLALWCGNNEIESAWVGWGWPDDPEARGDYLRLFEEIIPDIVREENPDTFYWPSSPSTGGGFDNPSGNDGGDMHYWDVWHCFKPIEAFRETLYRFCSEYGFESLPDMKTIRAFADESKGDFDLTGPVMEAHQKCNRGSEKVLYYLAQMVNYPYDFARLVYCSQLVQADCIRSNVEHMRRHRGICMGSSYWQINDSNPVVSWSGIDYFGRWKALHYAARRFHAPLLISCDDTDPSHPVIAVTNDTRESAAVRAICRLRDHRAKVLREYEADLTVPALSSVTCMEPDLAGEVATLEQRRTCYLEYELTENGIPVSGGTSLFLRPKAFRFLPARIQVAVKSEKTAFRLTLSADVFVKSVCLSLKTHDAVFSDNWFDIHGERPVTVTLPKTGELAGLTAKALEKDLQIVHY
ncbi:MAG: glycoside hydrolase family 2 protein [Clostridia bacterium]|nr:glycoside hydrolase family 2 protein [Clostridia bacterium]